MRFCDKVSFSLLGSLGKLLDHNCWDRVDAGVKFGEVERLNDLTPTALTDKYAICRKYIYQNVPVHMFLKATYVIR